MRGLVVMRLSSAPVGEVYHIKAIWGGEETEKLLKEFGLTVDSGIYVILKTYGDTLVVRVHDRFIALEKELAYKIIV